MREKTIEAHLIKRVKEAGGTTKKWTSPGNAGVPDRIVFFPEGRIFFVETKSPTGDLRPTQVVQHRNINSYGHVVFVLKTKKEVDDWVWYQQTVKGRSK